MDWIKTQMLVESVEGDITLKEYVGSDVLEYLHPYWWNFKPMEYSQSLMFAGLFGTGGLLGAIGNFLVLYIFLKYDVLRKPANILVMNLAICDLMLMVALVPETTVGLLLGGKWPYGYTACMVHAFCGAFFGYGQIATLVCIAYDRYNVIVKGITSKPLTIGRVRTMLSFIWFYSAFWAIGPLVGFGSYGIEGFISACTFDYLNRDPVNVKYIVASCVFCFLVPLLYIMYYYYSIVKAVWAHEAILKEQARKMNVTSLRSNDTRKRVSAEIRIAKVAITNVGLWVITWTPFTIVSLIGVLGNYDFLTPYSSIIVILLAKFSCFPNPIIYALLHPKYRECLMKTFCCARRSLKDDNQSTASEITKIQDP